MPVLLLNGMPPYTPTMAREDGFQGEPVSDSPEAPNCSRAAVLGESANDYCRVVAVLNVRWRVIECRDRIQWILQFREKLKAGTADPWRGRSYCRTREAVLRLSAQHAGRMDPVAAAALAALPDWIAKKELADVRN